MFKLSIYQKVEVFKDNMKVVGFNKPVRSASQHQVQGFNWHWRVDISNSNMQVEDFNSFQKMESFNTKTRVPSHRQYGLIRSNVDRSRIIIRSLASLVEADDQATMALVSVPHQTHQGIQQDYNRSGIRQLQTTRSEFSTNHILYLQTGYEYMRHLVPAPTPNGV